MAGCTGSPTHNPNLHLLPCASRAGARGFTLVEILITAGIVGAISAVVFRLSTLPLGRDQANAATAELIGWLDSVSTQAMQYGPCTVFFTTGNNLTPGTVIARVSDGDPRCSAGDLRLPGVNASATFNVFPQFSPINDNKIVFTQRGGVVAQTTTATIKIVANNSLPLRCVRVFYLSLSLGINNTGTDVVRHNCTTWERI